MAEGLLSREAIDLALREMMEERGRLYGQEPREALMAAGMYTGLAMAAYSPDHAKVWLHSFEAEAAAARGITAEQQEVMAREAIREAES